MKIIGGKSLLTDFNEPYRRLRTHLQCFSPGDGPKTVLITSASPGEGKTTVAANLAYSLQQVQKNVLLIDCDFRKPLQSKISFFVEQKGLLHYLRGDYPLNAVVKQLTGNWAFIPAGELNSNSAEVLLLPEMRAFLENSRPAYDWIIIDSPAVLPFSDAQILATMADQVILVVATGKSDPEMLGRTCQLLRYVHANIIGTVLNKANESAFE